MKVRSIVRTITKGEMMKEFDIDYSQALFIGLVTLAYTAAFFVIRYLLGENVALTILLFAIGFSHTKKIEYKATMESILQHMAESLGEDFTVKFLKDIVAKELEDIDE